MKMNLVLKRIYLFNITKNSTKENLDLHIVFLPHTIHQNIPHTNLPKR